MKHFATILTCFLWKSPTWAFVPYRAITAAEGISATASSLSTSSLSRLNALDDDRRDDGRYQAALARNQRRTDVRNFLTQRALQAFIELLIDCRDPHTVRWLEEQYDFANLEQFHGTGALDLNRYESWDSLLVDLLQRPNDMVIVAAKRRGNGHGGWSTNNPHLEERFVEFEIDIEPASLVTRIVSVRQQIAREWVADLQTLVAVNDLILESYHNVQNQNRIEECNNMPDTQNDDGNNPMDTASSDECTNPEDLAAPSDPVREPKYAYERKANEFLYNKMMEDQENSDMPSSPLRKSSFDLLSLLATQEAVHNVLRRYMQSGDERRVSFQWLRSFYTERVQQFFDGHGRYGRADDFLQELLLAPPSVATDDNVMELVDPMRIAEDLLEARSSVALEWKDLMEHQVPADHMELQRLVLAVRMGQTPSELAAPQIEETVISEPRDSVDIYGEFE